MEVFDTKKPYRSYAAEGHAVLALLGIGTIRDFAQLAAINHETAGALLGITNLRFRKKHHILIRAHEALHSAYTEQRGAMAKAKRKFLKDWAKRWQAFALEEVLWLESPGRQKPETSLVDRRRVAKRREAVKAAVKAAFNALKWV